jgi:hypothetical protein
MHVNNVECIYKLRVGKLVTSVLDIDQEIIIVSCAWIAIQISLKCEPVNEVSV